MQLDSRELKKYLATYSGQNDQMLDVKKHYFEFGHLTLTQAQIVQDNYRKTQENQKRVYH